MISDSKKVKITIVVILFAVLVAASFLSKENNAAENIVSMEKPNIIVIYMDDLGYGDLSAYGATELQTPNIDALADGGVRFTNGYASSATCTPSRYALLTGVYPWRKKGASVLPPTAPLLIELDQPTLPKMLKEQGYATGIVGKWHLGLGNGEVNWNQKISPGPNEVGFDFAHILASTQDRVPSVYIENGHVVNLDPNDPIEVDNRKNFSGEPTGRDNPEMLKMMYDHGHDMSIINGISRIGYMKGGESAKWIDEDMAYHFLGIAQDFVEVNKERPFFLYYALQQPHVPRTPHSDFVGKSGMGPRGDVILEADYVIGEFMKTLEREGLLENTFIIFTSDNGPVLNDGYVDQAVELLGSHDPAGGLRGGKYSLFEAGTKVPFITYWKGRIKPGVSDAMVSQLDFLSSIASLTGGTRYETDSQDMLAEFLGESVKGRESIVLEATRRTCFRKGDWVMIPPHKGPAVAGHVNIELGNDKEYQLYNIRNDRAQQRNLASENPRKLKEMIGEYEGLTSVK